MPQDNPPLLDKTMNTTESTPRNLADVLASGLANIANNVKPDGSDISINVPGMSATNVDDGFSELKGTLTDFTTYTEIGVLSSSHTTLTFSKEVYKVLFLYVTVGANTIYINTLPVNSQYAIANGQTFKIKDFDGNSFIFTVSTSGNNITFTYSSSTGVNATLRVLGYK